MKRQAIDDDAVTVDFGEQGKFELCDGRVADEDIDDSAGGAAPKRGWIGVIFPRKFFAAEIEVSGFADGQEKPFFIVVEIQVFVAEL